ncbi:hypothetical protein [Pseudonocardia sp. Ae717_Ps2]|uniref:hypothetical protein n=1 Tax=Pseudonocardia sp. Ae717_Ps2 TaxID=1885573 RepID=UPI00094AF26B|nr:hypothetical protein [Pseudonocardia sp. Ae717_Ps2]
MPDADDPDAFGLAGQDTAPPPAFDAADFKTWTTLQFQVEGIAPQEGQSPAPAAWKKFGDQFQTATERLQSINDDVAKLVKQVDEALEGQAGSAFQDYANGVLKESKAFAAVLADKKYADTVRGIGTDIAAFRDKWWETVQQSWKDRRAAQDKVRAKAISAVTLAAAVGDTSLIADVVQTYKNVVRRIENEYEDKLVKELQKQLGGLADDYSTAAKDMASLDIVRGEKAQGSKSAVAKLDKDDDKKDGDKDKDKDDDEVERDRHDDKYKDEDDEGKDGGTDGEKSPAVEELEERVDELEERVEKLESGGEGTGGLGDDLGDGSGSGSGEGSGTGGGTGGGTGSGGGSGGGDSARDKALNDAKNAAGKAIDDLAGGGATGGGGRAVVPVGAPVPAPGRRAAPAEASRPPRSRICPPSRRAAAPRTAPGAGPAAGPAAVARTRSVRPRSTRRRRQPERRSTTSAAGAPTRPGTRLSRTRRTPRTVRSTTWRAAPVAPATVRPAVACRDRAVACRDRVVARPDRGRAAGRSHRRRAAAAGPGRRQPSATRPWRTRRRPRTRPSTICRIRCPRAAPATGAARTRGAVLTRGAAPTRGAVPAGRAAIPRATRRWRTRSRPPRRRSTSCVPTTRPATRHSTRPRRPRTRPSTTWAARATRR